MLRKVAAPEGPDAVDVSRLTIDSVNGVRILEDVSVSIAPGETVGVLGESGSGKSMTALAILGLLPDTVRIVDGSVRVNDQEVRDLSAQNMRELRRSQIGMVFQDPALALDPTMKIGRQITETLWRGRRMSRASARQKAIDLLTDVEIPDPEARVDLYPHEMSGGMRQRAVIAMALAGSPSIILADEPTTAVDATIQARILELLAKLKAEHHLALLLISHDLRVISQVADRVVVMYAGRVVESGPTERVFADPQHWYTAALIRSIPSVRRGVRVEPIPGLPATPGTRPSGCAFHPRCPAATEICTRVVPPTVTLDDARELACHHPRGADHE